jgi:hypothetical protein
MARRASKAAASFEQNTTAQLPLYAVGLCLALTLSQTGMILHWRHHRDQPHWRKSMAFNAIGAVLSRLSSSKVSPSSPLAPGSPWS